MDELISREAATDVPDTNVGDMISRQAVMDALLELYEYQRDVDPSWAADLVRQGIFLAEKKIEDLPSADAIDARQCRECKYKAINKALEAMEQPEIIYCKDCKWYGRADKRRFYRGMDCLQHRIDTIVPDKDFCSRAERKEHETD